MRFATKFDRWLVVVLVFSAAVTGVVMPAKLLAYGRFLTPVLLAPAVWAVVLLATLPQYYEVRPEALFIRQGWRRILIPYANLSALESVSDYTSAGVFSSERVVVTTLDGRCFVIAPAEQARFLDEVALRTPQLERRGSGLSMPFSALSGI